VVIAIITGNLELASAPGNILLPASTSGLPRDSVVNVSQLMTLDRSYLTERAGILPHRLRAALDTGLRLALEL
jgi:mRNA interferase MazF